MNQRPIDIEAKPDGADQLAVPHILIVEDSPTQAERLRDALEQEGWSVTVAPSVEPAWAEMSRRRPDLMIVEFHLPGMLGDQFCRRVRMNLQTREIPILMLTAEKKEVSETLGLEAGADDYLSKGDDPDILLIRVRSLLRKHAAARLFPRNSNLALRNSRLLTIDDSATYRAYLSEELRLDDFEVQEASGGAEGLERLHNETFDCVLVDLIMPEMDGIEVCRRISELRRAKQIPMMVLMLTSRENKEDMTSGLEAGADDFVGKSSDIEVLKARLRTLLRRKFFQEENQRILAEIQAKELEAVEALAAQRAAETRAALVEELERANRELREAQTHLIQSEKMASLGQLVAGIAHEVNNPLTFVLNSVFTVDQQAEKILTELGDDPPDQILNRLHKMRARLADMQEGLDRVKDLVVSLRTFSRLDEGEFKTVDVHEGIDSVLMFLRHKTEGSIEIVKRYNAPDALDCYAGRLNQVIMNLLSNAVDSIDGPGTITIDTREEGGMFVISIQDNGVGIPEDMRPKIFDPFFTTKPVGEGTGLGLAISYGIIRDHKGVIEVTSQEGRGSEFSIKIPLGLKGAAHGR